LERNPEQKKTKDLLQMEVKCENRRKGEDKRKRRGRRLFSGTVANLIGWNSSQCGGYMLAATSPGPFTTSGTNNSRTHLNF